MITTTKPTTPVKNPKSSITGFVLAVTSLVSSGIGYGLVHARPESTGNKTADVVQNGVGHSVLSLVGVPFLIVGIALAIIAVIFVLMRFTKGLKTGAVLFSIASILLSVWSFSTAVNAFSVLKAH